MRLIDEPSVTVGVADEAGVEVHAGGAVRTDVQDAARSLVRDVLARHDVPPAACRIRLSAFRGGSGPLTVQVNVRVCGAPARVQVEGADAAVAIATAASRLHRHIVQLRHGGQPWSWPDTERRPRSPQGKSSIGRVKSYRLQVGRACQAAATLFALDYDAHLFTDAETGQDAVIYRSGPTGLRVARQYSMHPPALPDTVPLTVNSHATPRSTPVEAAQRLSSGWLPFLFFTDRVSGRGHLCYRRYDGAVGLVRPAEVSGSVSPGGLR